jgi:2',3'-cyclic-nucleotide 3'-phosphodiesterase
VVFYLGFFLKIMFINRGLPGSGKSTLSKKIAELYGVENTVICSGDDYFTDEQGNYKFDREKLAEAHETARQKAIAACLKGQSPVIADNTNLTLWEVKKYTTVAKENNYIVLLVEPRTPHKFDPDILASKSSICIILMIIIDNSNSL